MSLIHRLPPLALASLVAAQALNLTPPTLLPVSPVLGPAAKIPSKSSNGPPSDPRWREKCHELRAGQAAFVRNALSRGVRSGIGGGQVLSEAS